MLTSADLLVVTNEEDEPLTLKWDGKVYGVPPGASVHLPFDVVRKDFGDPRSGATARTAFSEDGRERIHIPSRADEIKRLSAWYGLGAKQLELQKPLTLADVTPKVSVTTVDGTPIATVVDDPGGDAPAPIPVNLDSPEAVAAQVAQMQRDLDSQRARLEALLSQAETGAGEDDTKVDGPGNRPKGGQPGAGPPRGSTRP